MQERDAASVLSRYRALLAMRKRHPALIAGSIEFLETPQDLLAFVRADTTERLLCVFNFADEPLEFRICRRHPRAVVD